MQLEKLILPFEVESKAGLAAIGAIGAAVAAASAAIVVAVKATFDWAAELDSIQDVMGVTNKEAAALNFVLRKSGTETDKLTKGMTILEKGLVRADGTLDTTGKKLEEFGISALDVNGRVKDQAKLFDEIGAKYNSFSTQQERVNFLTEIFGKSGAELIDVFDVLASEGGLEKTTKKVESLGLAIDPAKYENFTRNLEEIKLAGLGLAMTVVDSLMPALEGFNTWWNNKGLPAAQDMKRWLDAKIPVAIDTSKRAWTSMGNTYRDHVNPAVQELIDLWNNLSAIATRLDPQVGDIAGKFTILGATQRVAVAWATVVNSALSIVTAALQGMNNILANGIALWDRLRGASAGGIPAAPQSTGVISGRSTGGGLRSGRASGGAVIKGQSYNILELGKSEVFTPNQSGRVDKEANVTARLTDNDIDRLAKTFARTLAPQLAKVI